jgi:DNA invertase Pin-like site-specific DNA recombinase
MSAKTFGRPIFNEMIKRISAGEANTILCWKSDRLSRNPTDSAILQTLLQQGTLERIVTFDRTYHSTDNVLIFGIEQLMANQYIRELSANVKRGNREKLRRGEWINRAPYGYKNDKNTKTLVVVASQAKIVRQAFSLYATGNYSFTHLAKELGIQKSQLERILSRKFYYGVMEAVGGEYPGIHKPIITKQLFDQVQAIKTGVTVTKARPQKLEFPYRGFMYCAECGCMLTATVKKGKYDYYYCTNGKGICTQHKEYLNDKAVTSLLAKEMQKLYFDEEIIKSCIKQTVNGLKMAHTTSKALLTVLTSNFTKSNNKSENCFTLLQLV